MAMSIYHDFSLVVSDCLDDEFYQLLRRKLQDYNRRTALGMEPPRAIPLNISVQDESGQIVGGLAAHTYWGWLVIKLMVLDDELRGNGLGHQLLDLAHDQARRRGCTRAQTTTYDFQALAFYQKLGYRIVGELNDFPDGYTYYWLRKDFDEDDRFSDAAQATTDRSDTADRRNGV